MENNTDDTSMIVQTFHEEKLKEFIPVIVILSLVSLCGQLGNAFTIGFYGFHTKWTPTVLMITALAFVDLFICLILVHAILEIGINVYYTNRVTCKLFHFLVHWAMVASALILGLVSIDRYRRICRPLKKQIDITLAKRLVVGAVTFACLLSIRDIFNFEIIKFRLNVENNSTIVSGHYCTTTDNPDLEMSVNIFLWTDALLIIAVIVTLVVTYGNVVIAILKRGRSSLNNPKPSSCKYSCEDGVTEPAGSTASSGENNTDSQDRKKSTSNTMFKSKLRQSERSITLLMILVSLGFFCSFVPYFIIKLGIRSMERASDLELGAVTQFGIRLVYVNSVLNPLIFCAFNPQFRNYIKGVVSRHKGSNNELDPNSEGKASVMTESTMTNICE